MKYKLGEIANITKLAGFEFSKDFTYVDNGEIIVVRALNLKTPYMNLDDIKYISKDNSLRLPRSILYSDEIVLTTTGNGVGECSFIRENNKYHMGPNICKISPNKSLVDPFFLFSLMKTQTFQNEIKNHIRGSGQPTLPAQEVRILSLDLPSLSEQQRISRFARLIEDKIELNNKINDNLYC